MIDESIERRHGNGAFVRPIHGLVIRSAQSNPPDAITRLIEKILYRARAGRVVSIQVLENTPTKRHHTVNSEFFTSIGFTPMGGMVRLYNTRKGKSVRLLCEVLNIPPACFKTGKSHKGVRQMNTTTSASAPAATSSTTSNPILTASEQASENAAMAKMFAEVRKAEAQDRIRAAAPGTTDAHAAQPAESTINVLTARRAVTSTIETLINAQDVLDKLSGLFYAIERLPENHATTKKLASIGNLLSEDWMNIFDCDREVWESRLAFLDDDIQGRINSDSSNIPFAEEGGLSPSILVDDAFNSPLMALLNQLVSEGRDIAAPLREARALRAGLKNTVRALDDIQALAWKTCYQSCEVSGGAK